MCNYTIENFYHHSLVGVIEEKLKNHNLNFPHFYLKPYELFWQLSSEQEVVHLHGELYTLPAFMEAHLALQDNPGEPGCTLP